MPYGSFFSGGGQEEMVDKALQAKPKREEMAGFGGVFPCFLGEKRWMEKERQTGCCFF